MWFPFFAKTPPLAVDHGADDGKHQLQHHERISNGDSKVYEIYGLGKTWLSPKKPGYF